MDKFQSQQPQQVPEAERPPQVPLLGLNSNQEAVLQRMYSGTVASLMQVKFNDPENDALRMRQHSYLSGVMDGIMAVVRHDAEVAASYEQELKAAVDRTLDGKVATAQTDTEF